VLVAAAESGVECVEYAPAHVKSAICGYGRADKKQMQMMVKAILSLSELPTPDHAADALGVAICHEAFRYPEISRALALGGAQVIFVPHDVWTDDGSWPTRWRDPENPYNETALRLRALENTVYVAQANVAAPDQGSITGIVAPDGSLLASLPYGEAGVVAADVDLELADRRLALRWAPERNAPV
jgi:apolipoprotein N-acyltransferase